MEDKQLVMYKNGLLDPQESKWARFVGIVHFNNGLRLTLLSTHAKPNTPNMMVITKEKALETFRFVRERLL